jgi:hypothetical protein
MNRAPAQLVLLAALAALGCGIIAAVVAINLLRTVIAG